MEARLFSPGVEIVKRVERRWGKGDVHKEGHFKTYFYGGRIDGDPVALVDEQAPEMIFAISRDPSLIEEHAQTVRDAIAAAGIRRR